MTQPETCERCPKCGCLMAENMAGLFNYVHVPHARDCERNQLTALRADLKATKREVEEKDEQLQTVHAHVKEAIELLGVDVSVSGYIPDSWTLREQCHIAGKRLAEKEAEAGRLREAIESVMPGMNRAIKFWQSTEYGVGSIMQSWIDCLSAALPPTQEKNDASE